MKKALILSALLVCGAVLLAMSASTADAQLHLGWTTCRGAAGNTNINRNFNCATDDNEDPDTSAPFTHRMKGSYFAPSGVTNMVGNEAVLDYLTAGGTLAAWWDFPTAPNPAGCRTGEVDFVFRSAINAPCLDWPGAAGVGGGMVINNVPPDRGRIRLSGAYQSGSPQPLTGGAEYQSFFLTIKNGKTVGPPTCAGCTTPACIVLNSIKINQFPSNPTPIVIETPGPKGNYLTWQGGAGTNCPGATPTRKSSWGQLKSLYR